MNRRTPMHLLLPWLVVCACTCDEPRAPERSVQSPVAKIAEPAYEGPAPTMPPPEGTPLPVETLKTYAPDTLAGFTAKGAVEPRSTPLPNGGQLPAVRRTYANGPYKLQYELSDSLHAPGVAHLVASQQGETRKTNQVDFRGMEINGYPAIVQWHSTTETAIVNMLIGGRFLANVKVSPVDAAEPAIEVANALPVAEIAKLAPAIPLPEKPAAASGQPGAATSPPGEPASPTAPAPAPPK